ncbi:MAG: thiamine pyrophosphate-dependent enzyme [Acidobacteriota bacterium]|nr:thiamine pyrophosphate-dependent enzyme [Acidobacteriota bacterium]
MPAAFMRAYATAVQPPAGPVFLSLPMDDFEKPSSGDAVVRTQSQRVGPDPVRLQDFARQISQAKSPVLVLGAALDHSHGWPAAQQLAEKLKVPVWTPPETERAVFSEEHPLFQGFLPFAIAPLSEKLKGHDLVVVIGAPVFRYYPYVPGDYLPSGARLLHITDDPAEAVRAPVGDSLLADARLAVEGLLELVEPKQYPAVPSRVVERKLPNPPGATLVPAEVFATLQANRPADAVLLLESTSNAEEFHKWVPITRPHSFTLFASGGLGWALPAAVGFALAERDTGRYRPVLVILGDGATNYSIQALYTAAQHNLPVVFLVLCNAEYGILKAFAKHQKTSGVPGMDLPGLDFVALATGYGCTAFRVATSDALAQALRDALRRAGPTVLEIPITAEVGPLL